MKKIIPVIFVLVAAFLAVLFFSRNLFVKKTSISRSRVVIPIVGENSDSKKNNEYSDDFAQASFIQLSTGETLVGTLEMDIDGDGFDDQVNMVKTAASPYIVLIVALYNGKTGSYTRSNYLATEITQMKTFACTSIDVLGNHKNALVYQGVTDSGKVVLNGLHLIRDILPVVFQVKGQGNVAALLCGCRISGGQSGFESNEIDAAF